MDAWELQRLQVIPGVSGITSAVVRDERNFEAGLCREPHLIAKRNSDTISEHSD